LAGGGTGFGPRLSRFANNLPIQLTSFIGREKEIAEIKNLLEHNRLVTLTGSGGVGKTRHSLQVGAELLDAFADGVWLIELASVSDPGLVLPSVAAVLGVHEDEGHPLTTALQDHLRAKTVLLLLDNCEHLLEASAQLADVLLHACPHLKILVSSREALGMAGEVSFHVPSLSLPDAQHLPSLERLTQYDSVRLFIERAVAVKSDFIVTNENAPAVAQVCSRLDGIPLAIELAAARVKGLSVDQISIRLDDRFRLLTGGSRTALPRQQTLRAMIEWSYDLLSEPERLLLRRSAVFVSDWTLEAAEAVCAEPDPADGSTGMTLEVMDILLRLVDKSLIIAEEKGRQARYRMLESIRQYASEKLMESGEEESLRGRHLEFFLTFSEQAEPKLNGAEQLIWLNGLGAEYANLQAALVWSRQTDSTQPKLRLAQAIEQLADVQLLLGAGTQAIPRYQEALELWQNTEGADIRIEMRLHGKILHTVRYLKFGVDSHQFKSLLVIAAASSTSLEEALKKVEREPPSLEKIRLLTELSSYAGYLRNPVNLDLAEQYGRTAVKMAEKLEATVELSKALRTLANLYYWRGLPRESLRVNLRRLLISRDIHFNNMRERVIVLLDTGNSLMIVGDYAQANPIFLEAESLAVLIQAIDLEFAALEERARCLFWLDRWDEILNLEERSRDMQRRYPLEQIGVSCLRIAVNASIHAMRGEMDLAVIQRKESEAIMTGVVGSTEQWEREQHY
jgi:predicted ATPase